MSPALRIAYRDALRSRGRSLLVLFMIALPVLGVTAADVVIHTSDVSGVEGLDRRLGTAAALVTAGSAPQVWQGADPNGNLATGGEESRAPMTLAQVLTVLGGDRSALEYDEGSTRVRSERGTADTEASEVDLRSPLASGLARLVSGRLPSADGEVVVNQALADRGPGVGDDLEQSGGTTSRVVGIAESAQNRTYPQAFGLPGAFDLRERNNQRSWLIGGAPVTWDQVLALNAQGGIVASRAVLLDPPPADQVPEEVRTTGGGTDPAIVAVAALIAAMALLEVVLLAGPAFAVGARRHARTLALMAASGSTPRQARRVILAGALVLGGVASVGGVVLGVALARLLQPLAQRWSGSWFGPFEVPWLQLLGIAGFGLLSALLAAVVPAFLASRQDVVAVLAGRRGDRPPSGRSPIVGLLLIGAGVAGSWWGAVSAGGEYAIAVSALVAVLGMILVVPVVLAAIARLGGRLPLPLRYAVRDAARHRTRTVPAVAAVAATVAGVVALGIGGSSDEAQNRATYRPQLPMGQGLVTTYAEARPDWQRVVAALEDQVPGSTTTAVQGVVSQTARQYVDVGLGVRGEAGLLGYWGGSFPTPVAVSRGELPASLGDFSPSDRARAAAVLERGGVVAFTDHAVGGDRVRVRVSVYDNDSGSQVGRVRRTTLPAVFLQAADPAFVGVISPQGAVAAGLRTATVGVFVGGTDISKARQQDAQEAVAAVDPDLSLYVERGYQADDDVRVLLLVLGALGGVLMLGGTLTATFLALADARPDLATLSAVGATPRTRRGVAAAYAVVVGLVGAVLGAAVGFVPGIAVTYPLTSTSWMTDAPPQHFLDVPWPLIGALVVALPLATAIVVGLTARSRLPLVARLD